MTSSAKTIEVVSNLKGLDECGLVSFPARYGTYNLIKTKELLLHFSPSWRLTHLQANSPFWPHPLEWIKIGLGGTKTYYSSIAYGDISALFQQHYIPICEKYPQIAPEGNPFQMPFVRETLYKLHGLKKLLTENKLHHIVNAISHWEQFYAVGFLRLLKATVTILPPDAMLCDYQVLPVIMSTGCLHNCGFCTVKDGVEFKQLSFDQIRRTITELKRVFKKELCQIKGIFLGNLDGLNCNNELILKTIDLCKKEFPSIKRYFLFGSVSSFLNKKEAFFKELDSRGLNFFINIGIESLDEGTLSLLNKPEKRKDVIAAWHKASYINKKILTVEITTNIIISKNFKDSHLKTLTDILKIERPFPKGTIYLSSLNEPYRRIHFEMAKEIKMATCRDVRLYPLVTL